MFWIESLWNHNLLGTNQRLTLFRSFKGFINIVCLHHRQFSVLGGKGKETKIFIWKTKNTHIGKFRLLSLFRFNARGWILKLPIFDTQPLPTCLFLFCFSSTSSFLPLAWTISIQSKCQKQLSKSRLEMQFRFHRNKKKTKKMDT